MANQWNNYQNGQTYQHNMQQQQQHQNSPPPPPPPYAYQQTAPHATGFNNSYQQQSSAYPVNSSSLYGVPVVNHQTQYQYTAWPQAPNNHYAQHQYYPIGQPPPPPPPTLHSPVSTIQQPQHGVTEAKNKNDTAEYKCDVCSVNFDSLKAFQSHTSSHIECSHPDCTFTASKKVVSAHYSSKHGKYSGRGLKTVAIQTPGLKKLQKFKICVGSHPDDIEAWIAERKKRFPTREKILKKEEKKKRRRDEGSLALNGRNNGCVDRKKICLEIATPVSKQNDKPKTQDKDKPKPVADALSNLACYGSSSDEEEDNKDVKSNEKGAASEEVVVGDNSSNLANHSAINAYEVEGSNQDPAQIETNKFKTKQCRYFLRNGTCKNGDACTYIHDMTQHEAYKSNRVVRSQTQSSRDKAKNAAKREMNLLTTGRANNGKVNGTSPSGQTLLRKLLQNDIGRERSLCLKLLRYIVDCNFLQEKRTDKMENDCEIDE
jgi:hypothetical protein